MSEMENTPVWPQEEETGHPIRGILGALIGALIGAALFAVLFYLGFISSLVGLVIVFLAGWLYQKFGGKPGGLQFVSMLAALIIGVSVGLAGGYTLDFLKEYRGADNPSMTAGEFVRMVWEEYVIYDQPTVLGIEYDRKLEGLSELERKFAMSKDEFIDKYYDAQLDVSRREMRSELFKNWLMGLGFGVLGCFGALGSSLKGKKG